MSVVYHSYDASNAAVNELVAGAYAEHVGTLGFDENLSTTSRNAVENRAITQRILQDEANYLLKTEAETKYAVEYVNSVPATVRDKLYSVNGNFYAGDSANSTLHEIGGKVKTVNSQTPDSNGNVDIEAADIPTSTSGVTVQDALDLAATKAYVQSLYPVGTIYMNDVATAVPFDFGTWDLIDEKFLYGCALDFSDIGTTGGASTVTLVQANLPAGNVPVQFPAVTGTTGNVTGTGTTWSHSHPQNQSRSGGDANPIPMVSWEGSGSFGRSSSTQYQGSKDRVWTDGTNLQHTHPITIPAQTLNISLGDGTAFDIIPPYHKCAIWHRVS